MTGVLGGVWRARLGEETPAPGEVRIRSANLGSAGVRDSKRGHRFNSGFFSNPVISPRTMLLLLPVSSFSLLSSVYFCFSTIPLHPPFLSASPLSIEVSFSHSPSFSQSLRWAGAFVVSDRVSFRARVNAGCRVAWLGLDSSTGAYFPLLRPCLLESGCCPVNRGTQLSQKEREKEG